MAMTFGARRHRRDIYRLIVAGTLLLFPGCATPGVAEVLPRAADLGWSEPGLEAVLEEADALGTAALLIVTKGERVLTRGNLSRRFRAHSLRKSFLSALYGIAVDEGRIDLSSTLAELRIRERTPLTAIESSATVADLLTSRSGVYLPAASETPSARAARPPRGSQAPGTYWYYNNWDFNVLGTIFEQSTQTGIFDAFEARIAEPLGMQDFTLLDTRYQRELYSIHPSYKFRISARDLARFGRLYLDEGRWGDRQIIPAAWIRESTAAHSKTRRTGTKSGYGYMFWVAAADEPRAHGIPRGVITGSGVGGQRLAILPSIDTVVVHLMDTEQRGGPRVTTSEFDRLLRLILRAAPGARPAGE